MYRRLLLEIGTEEIPARFMRDALGQLVELARRLFSDYRLEVGSIRSFGTPRRLVLLVEDLPLSQKEAVEEIKGPPEAQAYDANGHPTASAIGFARSKGVSVEDLVVKSTPSGNYVFAVKHHPGMPTAEVLPEVMERIVRSLSFPKTMYWHWKGLRFARPIRWILCLLDEAVVDFSVEGIRSGRRTRGHRFMGKREIELKSAEEYFRAMSENFVVVDPDERRKAIESDVALIEERNGVKVELDEALLEENVFLVEYPVVFMGSFSPKYLELPEEVLVTSMKSHQRYFAVRDERGKLLPHFVGVSNNRASNMEVVREGNHRVLRARLEDASFFFQEDLKVPMAERVEALRGVVYQEKLGTMFDKVARIEGLALRLCDALGLDGASRDKLSRAARLCKADLVTEMVFEFPELQGVMGREYLLRQGEDPEVAWAVFEHYLPRFAGDRMPEGLLGAVLGVADRADALVGFIGVGLTPSGSQDPYGLRRHARAIVELCWHKGMDLDLHFLFDAAREGLSMGEEALRSTLEFVEGRIYNLLRDRGYSHEQVRSAMAVGWTRPLDLKRRLDAVSALWGERSFGELARAATRVINISRPYGGGPIRAGLFSSEAESALFGALEGVRSGAMEAMESGDYQGALRLMADGLVGPIDRFFDEVLVMAPEEELRGNRINLLCAVRDLLFRVADFSLMGL